MYMTERGFSKLQTQLDHLRSIEQPKLAELLHDALGGGDLLDNTEYLRLRDDFVLMNDLIRDIENNLRNAKLIARGEPDGKVHIGDTVMIQAGRDQPETYTIVGSVETDPGNGYISYESPLGATLLDRAIGDEVSVTTPEGELRYRILAVT
jgi:transcription elongation factor GreA